MQDTGVSIADIYQVLLQINRKLAFSKEVLTAKEAAEYLGISLNTLDHYRCDNLIGFCKPNGKTCFYKREHLDQFAMQNEAIPIKQIEAETFNHPLKKIK